MTCTDFQQTPILPEEESGEKASTHRILFYFGALNAFRYLRGLHII